MKKKPSQAEYLLDIREKYVNKSNALIEKSRFSLTPAQQKILLTLIAQIKPSDDEFKEYKLGLSEFLKLCGSGRGSNSYTALKDEIKQLADKSVWVEIYDEDKREPVEILLRWIDHAEIRQKSGFMKISLHKDMRPYLLNLKGSFTKYQLLFTLGLRSKYSLRLYEYANCIQYDKFKPYSKRVTIEELTERLGAETYTEFRDFKRRALIPAITEINEITDKQIDCEYIKQGNKTTGVKLTIKTKPREQRDEIRAKIDRRFGLDGQLSLWVAMDDARGEQDE